MADEQNENLVDENPPLVEPTDIAQAFKMFNQANAAATPQPVASPEDTGSDDSDTTLDDGEGAEGTAPVDAGLGGTEGDDASGSAYDESDDGDAGGSSAVIEPIDGNAARQNMLKSIQQQAIANARKSLADDEIELWSLNDIYERDENTGRVTFHNPDDPSRPFQSRAEAQAFIDAMNKGVEAEFRNRVNQQQRELVQAAGPAFQVIDFAPSYQAMSEVEREVFDEIVEPYAIRNNSGKVIGFRTDLNAAANIAKRVASRVGNKTQNAAATQTASKTQTASNPGTRPATDLPSGSSQSNHDEKEPKTLGEALKMYDAQQRKAKGGKK